MWYRTREGKVNVGVLIVAIMLPALLVGGLFMARHILKGARLNQSLAFGQAAYDDQDWEAAVKNLGNYVRRKPEDVEVLKMYADALWSIRPFDARIISNLIFTCRRILEEEPLNEDAYERLVSVYAATEQREPAVQVIRTRLEHVPEDLEAQLRLADTLFGLNKPAQARETLLGLIERLKALPDRRVEYVRACVLMSHLSANIGVSEEEATAADGRRSQEELSLEWLDKAVAYMPDSAEALAYRARFLRLAAASADRSAEERQAFLARAKNDLMAADTVGTDDPRIRSVLAVEWLAHSEFGRATAELEAADALPREKIEEHFFDVAEWTVTKFRIASEVATRGGDTEMAVSLVDETLGSLSEARHRIQVLPAAVRIHASAGKAGEARRYLDEYVEMLGENAGQTEAAAQLGVLQALVASLENQPEVVIESLEPVLADDSGNPGLWRLMADAYGKTGQTERAIDALNRYLAANPDDPRATYELARQYSRSGQWARASEYADRAELLGITGVSVRLLRLGSDARLAIGQAGGVDTERLKELAQELDVLRRANPQEVSIRVFQALIAGYLGQPEEAEGHLKSAIDECEDDLRARIQLAVHYRRHGQVAEAIAVCREACNRHSEVATPWLQLADSHTANKDHDAARSCLREGLGVVAEDREKRSLSVKLALLELEHGDRAGGIGSLTELAARDEKEIPARVILLSAPEIRQDPVLTEKLIAELKRAEGERGLWWRLHQASFWLSSDEWRAKQTEAGDLLQYCIDTAPDWPPPVVLLAGMYNKLGESAQVEDICRSGLEENPSATEVADILLQLLYRQKRFSEAQEVLSRLRISPRAADDWQLRIARGTGDTVGAIDTLKLRVNEDNKDASAWIELARLAYQERQDVDEAFDYLKKAEAIDPARRTLVAVKVSILREEARPADALKVLNDYVADQNDFDAHWMRAVYLAEAGDQEQAESDYRKLTTFADKGAAGYELLGNFFAGAGELDQAVGALEDGLNAYPDSVELRQRLMRLLFQRGGAGDQKRASEILGSLREQLPLDAGLMTVEAVQMLAEPTAESLANARELLKEAVKLSPRQVDAHRALIGVAMQQGDYQGASDYAIGALDANRGNPVLLSARARAELALGYAPTAVKFAREALREDPNSTEAWSVLVEGAVLSGDRNILEQAQTLIGSAVSRDPHNERLLLSRARILGTLEQPRAAIPALEAYCQTEAGSKSVAAFVMVADLYRAAGDMDLAGRWIEKAEQVAPQNQSVAHARLLWLLVQERFEELGQISAAYIAAEEQDVTLVLRAASLLLSRAPTELKREGVKLFEHAASLAPTSAAASLGLASGLYQLGDMERAKKVYQELLKREPNNVQALNDLAWILQEQNQEYQAALELANRGLRLAPRDLHLLDTRATIYSRMPDQLANAKSDFERLTELSFREPAREAGALLKLVRVCVGLEDPAEAKKHAERGLEIDRESGVYTEAERKELTELLLGSEN